MICDVCKNMLERHEGYLWKGTYDLSFKHHTSEEKLKNAASQDCCICRTIYSKLQTLQQLDRELGSSVARNWKENYFTQASLSYVRRWTSYRLDFRLNRQHDSERVGSFFLKETGKI